MHNENSPENPIPQPGQPEEIIETPGSTAKALRDIQADVPRVNLARIVKAYEADPHVIENMPDLSEGDKHKAEEFALDAHFIREAWPTITEEIIANPPGFTKATGIGLETVSVEEVEEMLERAIMPVEVLDILEKVTRPTLQYGVSKWVSEKEASPTEDKNFTRYKTVMGLVDEPGLIEDRIFGGISTAKQIILNLFEVIPLTYQLQYKKPISKEELQQITNECLPLILQLAASHTRVTDAIDANLSKAGTLDSYGLDIHRLYNPYQFSISGEEGNRQIEISQEVFPDSTRLKSESNINIRLGCPALLPGENGKSAVADLVNWYINLAEEFYFPNIDKLTPGLTDEYLESRRG